MPTRQDVLDLLDTGLDYPEAAARLGIPAGKAYLIATGVPADGGDTVPAAERDRPGHLPGSTQFLVNPQPENPTTKEAVLAWVRTRARQDAAMQRAHSGRDAEPAEIEDPEVTDALTVLGRDHNQVKALLEQLSALPGHRKGGSDAQIAARKSIVDMIVYRLSQHETAEQELLWPAVRDALPDGDERADTALDQEQEGKDVLTAVGRVEGDSDEFDELVEKMILALRKHVAYEDRVFLDLNQAMPEADRNELGRRILNAKKWAPTRPHPHAPKRGAAVKAAGLPAAALDKARDALGDRPAEQKGTGEGASEQ